MRKVGERSSIWSLLLAVLSSSLRLLTLLLSNVVWEIKDLTLKYTQDHQDLPNRRLNHGINEESLQRLIADLNKRCLPKIPDDDVASAVEKIPPLPKEELFGRSSGSLEWRLSRGEISLVGNHLPPLFPDTVRS